MRKIMLFNILLATLIIAASARGIDVKNDPAIIGLWLLDEGSGTVIGDSSGNGNDGKTSGDFTWGDGKFGQAIIAPGTGQIDVAVSPSLNKVTKAMTIAAWFRVDVDSDTGIRRQNAYLLEDQSSSEPVPDSFSFRIWTSNGLSPGVYGKTKLEKKKWNHVAGTYDGVQMMLYINGVPEKELLSDANAAIDGKWGGDIGTPADNLQLKYGSESFTGGMDEIMLFSRALSANEIKELMSGAIPTIAVNPYTKITSAWAAIKRH